MQSTADGGSVELESSDEYAAYFNHLTRVFGCLVKWYKYLIEGGGTEERLLTGFLSRMLFTVEMLRLKHLYSPPHNLILDLNDSGLPHTFEIMEFDTDLRIRDDKLRSLSPRNVLVGQMVDEMIEKKQDPSDLLWQMSQLEFFTLIDPHKLMHVFTPGELEHRATRLEYRKYLYSWACYDFSTNTLFFHLMALDQDIGEEPLEAKGSTYNRFIEVVKAEGSRASSVGVLASQIDEALKPIHPKVLKRVRIGPILCPRFQRGQSPEPMLAFLEKHGDQDDFALKLMSEVIISQRQVAEPRKLLSLGRAGRVREVFAIPSSDLRCFEQQASRVFDHLIMPHHVLQQVIGDPRFSACYGTMQKITYTKEGGLNVV